MTNMEKTIKKMGIILAVIMWSLFIGSIIILVTDGLYNYVGPVLIRIGIISLMASIYFTVLVYKLFKETKGMK